MKILTRDGFVLAFIDVDLSVIVLVLVIVIARMASAIDIDCLIEILIVLPEASSRRACQTVWR